MVLRGKLRGRVGHCREYFKSPPLNEAGFFYRPSPIAYNRRRYASNAGRSSAVRTPRSTAVPFDDTIGGRAIFLDQSSVMGVLGRHAFSRMGKLKLAGWLADLEQKYRMVVYVVDTPVSSAWSQTSIRQADCVLMVGYGDEPAMGALATSALPSERSLAPTRQCSLVWLRW